MKPSHNERKAGGLGWRMRHSIGRRLPQRASLAEHPMLRPLARHVLAPQLWHLQHESVARGAAIGLLWAFIMPFGQIPLAAAHCVWWRGNIPVAIVATFLTNPFTLGFWLWLAFQVGAVFVDAPALVMPGPGTPVLQWLQGVGKPVVLGMGLLALASATCAYVAIKLGWRVAVSWRWRHRRRAKPRQLGDE